MFLRKKTKLFRNQTIKYVFLIILLFLFTVCGNPPKVGAVIKNSENSGSGKATTQSSLQPNQAPAFNIDSLDFSPEKINGTSYVPFDKVEDFYDQGLVFPMDLVNQVGKALYMNDVPKLMSQLNDSSLEISMTDFIIKRRTKQYDGSKLDHEEEQFYEDLDSGSESYIIYRFDGDLDGKDEIYMCDLIHTNAKEMQIYILEPNQNKKYQYSYSSFYDSSKYLSAFKYNGQYYFLFNHEDYTTNTTCSIELAQVLKRTNDYKSKNNLLTEVFHTIYLKLDQKKADYSIVYENSSCNLTENVEEYVSKIKTDLLQSNANFYGLFYGYEKEVPNSFIYSADVNNDGTDELFDRGFHGRGKSLDIKWYKSPPKWHDDTDAETTSQPFVLQSPYGYFLKQMWFITMDGKTITFRLFQNDKDLRFVLDACLYENKLETHLAVYKLQYNRNVVFAPYLGDLFDHTPDVKFTDPDHDKALGMFSDENYIELVKKYSSKINKVKYSSESFPSDIVSKIQEGLISSSLEKVSTSMQRGIETLSLDKFLGETAAYFDKETWQYFDTCKQFNCYKADINGDEKKEYIVFTSDGSAGFAQFDIYKLKNGKMKDILSQEGLLRGFNSLIHYGGKFYLISDTMDYNSKKTNGATIFRIFSNGKDKTLLLNLQTDRYKADINYSNNDDISLQIDSYIKSIIDKLVPHNDFNNYKEFVGDENTNLSMEEKSRLYSIGGRDTYYKVDYNNDGVDEYFTKYFEYPSTLSGFLYLNTKYYKLNDSVESFAPDFGDDGTLYQLWYKSFEGKFYTCRLLNIGDLYVVNVFLLEGNTIHQVYTYTLFPQSSLKIKEVDGTTLGPKG